jgi:hypothetical protein
MWIGFIWLRIGFSGRLLWTWRWIFEFHTRREIAWIAYPLLALRGLNSMDLIIMQTNTFTNAEWNTVARCDQCVYFGSHRQRKTLWIIIIITTFMFSAFFFFFLERGQELGRNETHTSMVSNAQAHMESFTSWDGRESIRLMHNNSPRMRERKVTLR